MKLKLLLMCLISVQVFANTRGTEAAFDSQGSIKDKWAAMMKLAQDQKISEEIFYRATQDKDCFTRNAGLVALNHRNPERSIAVAEKLLKDKALIVRSAALEIIKKYPHKMNRTLLWKELDQKYNFRSGQSLWIRKDLMIALAETPLKSEKPLFEKLQKDQDLDIRLGATTASLKLSKHSL